MNFVLAHCALLLMLLGLTELLKRSKIFNIFYFVPVFLFFVFSWVRDDFYFSFFIVKFFMMTLSFFGVQFFRWNKAGRVKFVSLALLFFLNGNMLIAVFYDLLNGAVLNPLAGIFLIISVFFCGKPYIRNGEVEWDISYYWIAAYLLWNFVFTTSSWIGAEGIYFIVLFSTLVYIIKDNKKWAQARLFTLFSFMSVFAFAPEFFNWFRGSPWISKDVFRLLELSSFCFSGIVSVCLLYLFLKKKIRQNNLLLEGVERIL